MSSPPRRTGPALVLSALLLVLSIAGCGVKQEKKLEGQRIPVFAETGRTPGADRDAPPLPAPVVVSGWPQYGWNASHTLPHAQMPSPPSGMTLRWSRAIGSGNSRGERIPGPPVAADGHVYALDAGNRIVAVDALTGTIAWSFLMTPEGEESGAIGGGLAWQDGMLVAMSPYGEAMALDGRSGELLWRHGNYYPFRGAPAIGDGVVLAVTLGNGLISMDARSGAELWSLQGGQETTLIVSQAAPALSDGLVVATFSSGGVHAVQSLTGRQIWDQSVLSGGGGYSSLSRIADAAGGAAIAGGRVYVASYAGGIHAFSLQTGQELWQSDVNSAGLVTVLGDVAYVSALDGRAVAIGISDGRTIWSRSLPAPEDGGGVAWYGPVPVAGQLVFTSSAGLTTLISPVSGELLGSLPLSRPASRPVIVMDSLLYLLDDSGVLHAFG